MIESQFVRSLPATTLPTLPAIRWVQKSVAALSIKFAGAGIALALQISLARALGHAGYGQYAYVFAWLQLLLLFSQGGLSIAAVRYVAEYRARKQPDLVQGFIRRGAQIAFVASISMSTLMCAAATFAMRTDFINGCNLLVAGIALPALAQLALNGAVIRGLGRAILGMLSQLAYQVFFLISLLAVSYLSSGYLIPSYALLLNFVSAIVALCISLAIRRGLVREFEHAAEPKFRTLQWLVTATEMLLVSGIVYIQMRTGVILSNWFLDPSAAGTYAAIERLVDVALLGLVSIELLIAPKFAELYAQNRRRELEQCARMAAWGSSSVTLAAAIVIVLYGRSILGMFGNDFVTGYSALLIMLLGVAARALCGSVGLLLCMTGYQRDTIIAAFICLLFSLGISLVLIPLYGIMGAATAFSSSMAIWCLSMLLLSRWRLGIWGCVGAVNFGHVGIQIY